MHGVSELSVLPSTVGVASAFQNCDRTPKSRAAVWIHAMTWDGQHSTIHDYCAVDFNSELGMSGSRTVDLLAGIEPQDCHD